MEPRKCVSFVLTFLLSRELKQNKSQKGLVSSVIRAHPLTLLYADPTNACISRRESDHREEHKMLLVSLPLLISVSPPSTYLIHLSDSSVPSKCWWYCSEQKWKSCHYHAHKGKAILNHWLEILSVWFWPDYAVMIYYRALVSIFGRPNNQMLMILNKSFLVSVNLYKLMRSHGWPS